MKQVISTRMQKILVLEHVASKEESTERQDVPVWLQIQYDKAYIAWNNAQTELRKLYNAKDEG